VSATITVRVDGSGDVRLEGSNGTESQPERVRLDAAQIRMVQLFQDWLAEGWADPQRRKITRRRELEVLGMLLYERLFPGRLPRFLDRALEAASADSPVRLELVFGDGAQPLASLPWEYLYRGDSNAGGSFFAIDERLALCRYIPLDLAVRPMAPERPPLRVLATVAKPRDLGPVREAETLDALRALSRAAQVDVDVLAHPTTMRLEDRVAAFRPHVVHVLAHGDYEDGRGSIALEDDAGGSDWVPDAEFADLFAKADATPHIVLLHACEGGTIGFSSTFAGLAPRLVEIGVQAVIAMQYPVTNGAASAFATAFYAELAHQRPIDAAVQAARRRMTTSRPGSYDTGEFAIPVLYLREKESTPVTVR
jgi:CHAT domain